MNIHHIRIAGLSLSLFLGIFTSALAYDKTLAERLNQEITSKADHKFLVEKDYKVSAEDVLKLIANKEKLTLLDIRTPAEQSVVGLTYPNSLSISLNKLMQKENLDRLPADGKIVVICHSGSRAAFITSLLQAVGFNNVVFLNGGLIQLVTALTPKTVPVE